MALMLKIFARTVSHRVNSEISVGICDRLMDAVKTAGVSYNSRDGGKDHGAKHNLEAVPPVGSSKKQSEEATTLIACTAIKLPVSQTVTVEFCHAGRPNPSQQCHAACGVY